MLRLLSLAALASAAIIATSPNSPASAAALTMNNVGAGAHVSAVTNRAFAPNIAVSSVQIPGHEPKYKKWVCGPIVNWDGSPHCHWVPTPTYP
ncbi:MAG TPA: hypothetical protein VII40_06030 [Xanthobacteraceae bacterium]|jgi:hypothetical protein